jgi:hypothetical protein
MHFRIGGIDPAPFQHLFALSDDELARHRAKRYFADEKPGFPCRISLEDAEPGERVILAPFAHQTAATAYQSAGPIFVREAARKRFDAIDEAPVYLRSRLLSLRAYDSQGMMVDAEVADGAKLEAEIARLFAGEGTAYIHAHFARRGCYAARIDRA